MRIPEVTVPGAVSVLNLCHPSGFGVVLDQIKAIDRHLFLEDR